LKTGIWKSGTKLIGKMDNICRLRLCRVDKLVADGPVQIGMEKRNAPPKYSLMRVWKCLKEGCGRERHEFWSDKERLEWRRMNGT
jgi:hypothetical protein